MSYWSNVSSSDCTHTQDSWILQEEETPYPANDGNPLCVYDLTKLVHLHEPALLHVLKSRFADGSIYTLSGSMLLSLNPFKKLKGLYSDDIKSLYRSSASTNPHLFQVAQKALDNLKDTGSNQSLLVSGESGAGKTVATRIILDYLSYGNDLNEKILCANPILEALGNAVTLRNHNSSRFGKYIKIHCDPVNGHISSASIQTYLLEEVRVTSHGDGEGPFHIFTLPSLESEVNGSRFVSPPPPKIYNEDGPVWEWMTKMGFSFKELQQVESVVRGIGILGRVEWNVLDDDSTAIRNPEIVTLVAQTLQVDETRLTYLLTHKTIKTAHETIETNLSLQKAKSSVDAWAGWLYSRLFDWVVKRINGILSLEGEDINPFIGLLDIFGFEVFQTNGLEQLCINYTNERIQALFNHHIFVEEQAEYVREGIDWSDISFPSNETALSSIHRLLCAVTEECMIPRGCDQTFASKLKDDGPITVSAKQRVDGSFEICHYAGAVVYSSNGFCAKNKGDVGKEWIELTMEFLPWLSCKDNAGTSLSNRNKKRDTLLSSFDRNLDHLIETLEGTHQSYVRCLKPNDDLEADTWVSPRVADQLRYSGVIEAVNIARLGFPVRYLHADFEKRFTSIGVSTKDVPSRVGTTKVFLKKEWHSTLEERRRQKRDEVATRIQSTYKGFKQRLIYLRIRMLVKCLQGRWRFLRAKRASIRLQAMVRMVMWEKRYQCFYWCVVALQRRWVYKLRLRRLIRIQTWWRAIAHRKAFVLLSNLSTRLQGSWKIFRARRFLKESLGAIRLIQRWWRKIDMKGPGNLETSFYTAPLYASFSRESMEHRKLSKRQFPDLPPSPIQLEVGVQTETGSDDESNWDTIMDIGLERQVENLKVEVKLLKAGWKASQESLREMGMRFEPLIRRVGELEEENKRLRDSLKRSLKDTLVVKGEKWIRKFKK